MLNSSGNAPSARTAFAAPNAIAANATIPARKDPSGQQLRQRLRELHDHEPVVLAGEPEIVVAADGAEAHVGRDAVGGAILSAVIVPHGGPGKVLRPLRGRLVVGDLLRQVRIADVEDAQPRAPG